MSTQWFEPVEFGSPRYKQGLEERTRQERRKSHSASETQAPNRIKLSARDVLAALSSKRINETDMKFLGDDLRGRGGMSDVVIAVNTPKESVSGLGRTVAVKKFRLGEDINEEKFLRAFTNELRVLDGLCHPNIVNIIGFVEDIKKRICWLVFPWESNGNLREFLINGNREIPERVSLIKDVAFGLEYLHTSQPPVCHGDLKSLNVLVNSAHRAVITDFGSARILKDGGLGASPPLQQNSLVVNERRVDVTLEASETELTLTGPSWSFRWVSPEVLYGESPGLASDVWALGWIAWEAMTDNYPFPETKNDHHITIKIVTGQLPSIYKNEKLSQVLQLCRVMMMCWKSVPEERPSAAEFRSAIGWIPSAVPSADDDGNLKIRSTTLLRELGEMYRFQNRYPEALNTFLEGLAIARSAGDTPAIASFLLRLGYVHQSRSGNFEAEESYSQALNIYTSLGKDGGRAKALHGLGDIQQIRSNYPEAEKYYSQVLSIYTELGSDLGRANAYRAIGDIQQVQSKHKAAESSYTQALSIYTELKDDWGRANALRGLGDVGQARSNYADAEKSYTEVLLIYTALGNDLGRADALRGLGYCYQARFNYSEAEGCYTQAVRIYTDVNNDFGRGDALRGLGDLHKKRFRYTEAETAYTQSLEAFTNIGNDLGRANAILGLGDLHQAQSNYAEAEETLCQALSIYTNLGNELARANTLRGLGDAQQAQSRHRDAEESYSQALDICSNIGDNWGRATTLLGFGDISKERSDYADAEALYCQALEIFTNMRDDLGQGNALRRFGDMYKARSNYLDAEGCYTKALETFRNIGNDKGQVNVLLGLGQTLSRQARYAEAKISINNAFSISDQINHLQGRKRAEEVLKEVLEAEKAQMTAPPHSSEQATTTPLPPTSFITQEAKS